MRFGSFKIEPGVKLSFIDMPLNVETAVTNFTSL